MFGVLSNSHHLPANIPASTLQQILTLVHQPGSYYLLGTFERLMAICRQVVLSLLVLYSVRERKVIFLFVSIILHAMVDFVPGLYQFHVFPLWGVEGFTLFFGRNFLKKIAVISDIHGNSFALETAKKDIARRAIDTIKLRCLHSVNKSTKTRLPLLKQLNC